MREELKYSMQFGNYLTELYLKQYEGVWNAIRSDVYDRLGKINGLVLDRVKVYPVVEIMPNWEHTNLNRILSRLEDLMTPPITHSKGEKV